MKAATGRLLIALALVLGTGVATVSANAPPLPHAFYGAVEINGSPAPVGTSVEARGESVRAGTAAAPNPLITAEVGRYGGASPLDAKLIVQGEITNGSVLSFYVDGVLAEQTAEWHSGRVSEVDLSMTRSEPEPEPEPEPAPGGGGGGGGGSTPAPTDGTLDVTIGGTTATFDISPAGAVRQDIAVTAADGRLTVLVATGTTALDAGGGPLSALSLNATDTPPPPPPDTVLIGITYDFQPDGASFNPPLTLEWSYDPDTLPEGVSEDELMLAYYDAASGQWVELATTVDTAAHLVRASLSHFTHVAVCAPEPPAEEDTTPPADTTPEADTTPAADTTPTTDATETTPVAPVNEEEPEEPVATDTAAAAPAPDGAGAVEEEETAEPVPPDTAAAGPAPDGAGAGDEEAPAQPADSSKALLQVEWPLIAAISIAVLLAVTFIVEVLRRRSY